MKKSLSALAVLAAITSSGCASVQQAVSAYSAAGVTAVKAAEDNNITLWLANVCGTPMSAVIRHPELVPVVKAACLPSGQGSNPAALLDAVPAASTTAATPSAAK